MTNEQKLREALQTIAIKARHNIPFYAYGDNEAACLMSELLREIAASADSWCSIQPTSDEGKALIDKMVDRFLSWPLPKDFMPDGGISFKPIPNHQPIGTNLLTAEQARKMIEHMQGDR